MTDRSISALRNPVVDIIGHPLKGTMPNIRKGFQDTLRIEGTLEGLLDRAPEQELDVWAVKLLAPHLPESVHDVRAFLTRIYEGLCGQETGFLKPKNPVFGDER